MDKITINTLIFILCTSLATAQVYKWHDENGNLVFSDSPPASGPISVPIKQGTVKKIVVDQSPVHKSTGINSNSVEQHWLHEEEELIVSKFIYNQVKNAREFLNSSMSKNTLNTDDILMADYIKFVFEQPESNPYLDYGDSASANDFWLRSDIAKRSLSEREKDIISRSMAVMVGRWAAETYQELDKSAIMELDVILQRVWTQMCAAMADGNIDNALKFFHSSTQSSYRSQFGSFSKEQLQMIAADIGQTIHFVKDRRGVIEYALLIKRNGQVYSQIVNFQAENDGQWKIKQF